MAYYAIRFHRLKPNVGAFPGCESVGFMDDFDKHEVLLTFTHRGRPTVRALLLLTPSTEIRLAASFGTGSQRV